ncbi:Rieske (2Fe-2S) domain protein [Candidatus Glomeribacter gigasporarum BEG34]|uniref:Rieske (2Fe-2S) domain protein n=1 Tax=Candidatus Glomeribacter gigasporarum BEG34 TaxID=1070319 RepID=G2J8G2_9BURK|nr:aromatic ring-hydroxylating dioxygenase subunit alpha [Candidatus Glomeribacter gigasporarum]CCD29059.1 Rieske (2Fe-2S) domain protein [Candidatus Glomeribacter gigasporarum BEG34]
MLDQTTNDLLTHVGPNTPCGNLLRRYWHPVGYSSELTGLGRTKRVRILGEDLVLARIGSGALLLVQERCPHRGASLLYGFVEGTNIRCAYHGWLYNQAGECIERPFESEKANRICKKMIESYPTHECGGLIFAYLGPAVDQPAFPNWDILIRQDGVRHFEVQDDLACNWLQMQENAVDVTHTYYLHSKYFEQLGLNDGSGFGKPFKRFGFQRFDWGIVKSWEYEEMGRGWGNLMVFPNMLRIMTEMHWRVPIDDTTTRIVWVSFTPSTDGKPMLANEEPKIVQQPKRKDETDRYLMDTFMSQDAMAVETQGLILDRSKENLGVSDRGVVMLRQMLLEQIKVVQAGGRPIANVYGAEPEMTDLRQWMGGYLPMSCQPDPTFHQTREFKDIFDDTHKEYEIPASSSVMR